MYCFWFNNEDSEDFFWIDILNSRNWSNLVFLNIGIAQIEIAYCHVDDNNVKIIFEMDLPSLNFLCLSKFCKY